MRKITTKQEYEVLTARMEELLKVVGNNTATTNKNFIELDIISDLIADYEEVHFKITKPTLIDVIKLRMYEYNLTQKKVAELLQISTSRVSEYLTGKSEPTLKVARAISSKLNIDPAVVLGV